MTYTVSDADAIAGTDCTKCGAAKGDPCVYVVTETDAYFSGRGATYRRKLERAGTPTVHVHWERRYALDERRRKKARKQALANITPLPPRRLAIMAAVRQWDVNEQMQLRAWLAEHGPILWTRTPQDTPPGAPPVSGRESKER